MYVYKKYFDEVFNLTKLIDNELLVIKIYDEEFYNIWYDEKMYDRLFKISKLNYTNEIKKNLYTDKIKTYLKIIRYSKKNDVPPKDIFASAGARELTRSIDKQILNEVLSLGIKNLKKQNNGI